MAGKAQLRRFVVRQWVDLTDPQVQEKVWRVESVGKDKHPVLLAPLTHPKTIAYTFAALHAMHTWLPTIALYHQPGYLHRRYRALPFVYVYGILGMKPWGGCVSHVIRCNHSRLAWRYDFSKNKISIKCGWPRKK